MIKRVWIAWDGFDGHVFTSVPDGGDAPECEYIHRDVVLRALEKMQERAIRAGAIIQDETETIRDRIGSKFSNDYIDRIVHRNRAVPEIVLNEELGDKGEGDDVNN